MISIITFCFAILVGIIASYFFFNGNQIKKENHYISTNSAFNLLVLFVGSAMVYFSSTIIVIWGVYLIFILAIMYSYSNKQLESLRCITFYLLFYLWNFITLFYSKSLGSGAMMALKLSFPILFFYLAYQAIQFPNSVFLLIEKYNKLLYLYPLLAILGFVTKNTIMGNLYYGMTISVFPLAMFVLTRKKKFLLLFGICFIPPLLMIKRTPLLGLAASTFMFLFFRYRIKALIPSLVAGIVSIVMILSIPEFQERIFGGDKGEAQLTKKEMYSIGVLDHINTSGRSRMWALVIDKFYEGNELFGCGSGTMKGFLTSSKNSFSDVFLLIHNDWLHLLCETGIIGVFLLATSFMAMLIQSYKYSNRKYNMSIRLLACCVGGTITSTCIHMYFENCINSIVFSMPFIMYAILCKEIVILSYRKKI